MDAREREATAQKYVEHSLRVWQQRLNLSGWTLKVALVHPSAMEPKTLGNIHWDRDAKTATINVLSSYDYTLPTPEMLDDMEFTIVHELVHLNLCSLPKSTATERNEEYAVNQLAHALIDLEKALGPGGVIRALFSNLLSRDREGAVCLVVAGVAHIRPEFSQQIRDAIVAHLSTPCG